MSESIGFVRNNILALFAYFGMSKNDAASVLLAFEKVDTKFTQTIDVSAFAAFYCGKHADCFVAMWNYYKPTLSTLRDELISRSQINTTTTTTTSTTIDAAVSYFNFITFLLFVFPTDYKELTKVVFWLVLYRPKIQISLDVSDY